MFASYTRPMSETFRAVTIADGELVLANKSCVEPSPDEAVIAVAAAGLNAADLLQRRGFYPAPPGWPADVPGLECAGTVVRIGANVDPALLGRRVAAIVGGGGQASECVVPASHLLQLPDSVDWATAGGFAEAFTTAYDALVRQAHLRAGERVAISGAAGGVGVAAVQLAAAFGARVVAVTRDDTHHEALRRFGASECVTIDAVTQCAPVDVILELVGAAHLNLAQQILAPRARVVVIGVGGGGRIDLDLLGIMARRATITGSTLRARDNDEKAEIAAAMQRDVVPLLAAGSVRVPLAATFALEDAEMAYATFAQPGKLGKIVLTTDSAHR